MSKKRLEEIKEEVEMLRGDMCVTSIEVGTSADSILDDMEWLIEQAELVQELEDRHYRQELIDEHIERLEKQNKRYKEALNEIKQDIQGDYTEKELSDYPLLEVIVEQIDKLLERDTDDRTVESPHSSWF